MRQEHVMTARAKGLRERLVIGKHAFRNAMLPVVTIGIQIGPLFAGAVLTETTTAWPGIGRLMVESIDRQDKAVVFGLALFMGACYMVSYLVVDLLYAYIDPRLPWQPQPFRYTVSTGHTDGGLRCIGLDPCCGVGHRSPRPATQVTGVVFRLSFPARSLLLRTWSTLSSDARLQCASIERMIRWN